MALEPLALRALLIEVVKGKPLSVLSLGYPDVLYQGDGFKDIPERADADEIMAWHNWPGRVLDTDALFRSLNISPTYLDVAEVRGGEMISDLNTEILRAPLYDVILDPGTVEHVFNIGNAFAFIAASLKVGGVVIHTNPLNMGNHGFWSLNPTAYADFYEANGFDIEGMMELFGPVSRREKRLVSLSGRFEASPNATLYCVARKVEDRPLTWPIQTKYRQNPTLKGAA